ncbi:glycoside hydrolase [Aspergillus transmontanensis]|uniref:chitinase n=1 Tax=Aspergillus transmontanensis TaxID=1034304 RepID=A0A5N6VHQ1_9EURO|nr:glycoside hydrolase [Aspergillus transmontanensis]
MLAVIGYYEGWMSDSKCHPTLPGELPLGILTHLYFAFAYIDPKSYTITTMSSDMSEELFTQVAAVKNLKPSLKIYVSVGGWTFSDNDTVTQPLFGDIAADATKRKTFASNTLKFLNTYGFDGIDIDWEYPGAGDRRGKPRDTDNYVKLLAELRSTFDASGRKLGITFTAPSSYWYLKWFDLPGLLKYADWMNFMTYDLHGEWDRRNAIGSIVQAHTNLTNIKEAADLLWRVGTDPGKVVMGFGFYGRTFTLENSGCTAPGCPFTTGGTSGPCTHTSGYLAYYEIQDLLDKNPHITPVHDKEAAVLHFTYDKDQWISYDDKTTFKQKLDWARSVGLGGSLIWASDQDTYDFAAHAALLGKANVTSAQEKVKARSLSVTQDVLAESVARSLNEGCYRGSECVNLDIAQVTCDRGYTLVGYDKDKCQKSKKNYGQPICCDTDSAPSTCQWRGGGRDCNGQCHSGEIKLFTSSTGGGDYNGFQSESGTKKCKRGTKAFCCEDSTFDNLTLDCYWTGCDGSCKDGEVSVAEAANMNGKCTVFHHTMHYCCKDNPVPLKDCHWVGKGDCGDNTCSSTEVTLATDNQGDSLTGCNWWRKKALCCTPQGTPAASCADVDLCKLTPGYCDTTSLDTNYKRRDLEDYYDDDDHDDIHVLERRAKPLPWKPLSVRQWTIFTRALSWPPNGKLFKGNPGKEVLKKAFVIGASSCARAAIDAIDIDKVGKNIKFDTEHVVEKVFMRILIRSAITKVLPSGSPMKAAAIDGAIFAKYWAQSISALKRAPSISDGDPLIPNDRMFSALGTVNDRKTFLRTEKGLNIVKGGMFSILTDDTGVFNGMIKQPASDDNIDVALENASVTEIFEEVRRAIGVWNYINHPEVLSRINTVRGNIFTEALILAENVPGFENLPEILKEVDADWYRAAALGTRNWVSIQLMLISLQYLGSKAADAQVVHTTVQLLKNQMDDIVVPALKALKN